MAQPSPQVTTLIRSCGIYTGRPSEPVNLIYLTLAFKCPIARRPEPYPKTYATGKILMHHLYVEAFIDGYPLL